MGLACARELADRGYRLSVFSQSERILEVGKDLNALAVRGSVTEPADLQRLVEETLTEYGQIDAVVNNTGHPPRGELLEFTDEQWRGAFDLLLMNVVRLSRLVVPPMLKTGGGAIVNISTSGAVEPTLEFPLSSAVRGALNNYTKLFATRFAADNIRMNNLLPGRIESYSITPEEIAELPMKRQGTIAEIAKTVAFLLSADAGYITGQNIAVDGGLLRSF